MAKKWWKELNADTNGIESLLGEINVNMIIENDEIRIGESRPEISEGDIDLDLPDILNDDVLPTSGIILHEHTTIIDRNYFVLEYIIAKEKSNVNIRDCW